MFWREIPLHPFRLLYQFHHYALQQLHEVIIITPNFKMRKLKTDIR